MMRSWLVGRLAAALVGLLVAVGPVQAERRIALVIGNDNYDELTDLEKAVSDAVGYAEVLRQKGFDEVFEVHDLRRQEMDFAIAQFIEAIQPGDTAVFIYSGHGWSDGAQNYILGIDTPRAGAESLLQRVSIPLQNGVNGVLDEIMRRGAGLKVAIIDACRDNPFTPQTGGRTVGLSRGLARVDPPSGTFVVFSAGTGQTALDRLSNADPDPNSVFTRTFLPMLQADMPLLDAIKETQERVYVLARGISHEQEPAYYDQVRGSACLSASCLTEAPAREQATTSPGSDFSTAPRDPNQETVFWTSIANSSNPADFQAYIDTFPNGTFAPLARNRLAALPPPTRIEEPARIEGPAVVPPPATASIGQCDRLAASPNNLDNPEGVTPVPFSDLATHAREAVAACEDAVASRPNDTRLQFQLGRAYHANGQYERAMEQYEAAAAAGDVLAMNNIGGLYQNGLGVAQSYNEARRWYERAADGGDSFAMYSLGRLYGYGLGMTRDYGEARRWYQEAADLGYSEAMTELGLLYEYGNGVQQNYHEARRWYERAADLGERDAARNIGLIYQYGRGVTQDYNEARRWYQRSADLGYNEAMTDLGLLYEFGRGVPQDYVEARRWYERAADLGEPDAMRNLGILYQEGRGVRQDFQEALRWYRQAAELNIADAMTKIGLLYADGRGVTQDYVEARRWYEQAAALGDVDAMRYIGVIYDRGNGVRQDYVEARRWYEQAAAQDDATAMYNLGVLAENGRGQTASYQVARDWYERAVAQGSPDAMHNLGVIYEEGLAGVRDMNRAVELYVGALRGGNDWTFEQFRTNSNAYAPEVRRAVQRLLVDNGFMSGAIDGAIGPQTRAALDAYERHVMGN